MVTDVSVRTLCAHILTAHIRAKSESVIVGHFVEINKRFTQLTAGREIIAARNQWTSTSLAIDGRSAQCIAIESVGTFITTEIMSTENVDDIQLTD